MLVINLQLPKERFTHIEFQELHSISTISFFFTFLFNIMLLPLNHSRLPCLELRISLKYILVKITKINKTITNQLHCGFDTLSFEN
jgi:hypothetical protein